MAKFIEVTNIYDEKKLVNTAWIETVTLETKDGAVIYTKTADGLDCIYCQETYEEVKAMILGKDEGK